MHRLIGLWVAASLFGGAATAASESAILLDRHPERVVAMNIAESSRQALDTNIPVSGPWRIVHTLHGIRSWEAALPVRTRTLFFHRPPAGMHVSRRDPEGKRQQIKAVAGLSAPVDTWAFSADSIQIRRPLSDGPPTEGEYTLRYNRAKDREQGLNRTMGDQSTAEFVFRNVQVGDTNRHGLHLPAPSEIHFALTVPDHGMLRFDASIIPPESAIPGVVSDGAVLELSVISEDGTHALTTLDVVNSIKTHRVDLSAYAKKAITLVLKTLPGPTSDLDYVFIAEPTVYTPQKDAPQMVLIFIDTLRADAMSLYGYHRETSPKLDRWAEGAAVFSQARSVAPWTLPSARTMITGTHPERWDKIDRLQSRMAAQGWATGMIAGNVYLSSNFEMAEDWGTHRCINWPQGSTQIRRGEGFLEAHTDQPSFLLLHLMDMHLPYTEPIQYRSLFAGDTPAGLDGTGYFLRNEVNRVARKEGDKAKAYFRGRYDNNMRYLDDQLDDFLGGLREDAIVMIISDHGEEFWDHGGFEHGHSLFDELLRVPMVLKGPGVTAGRFSSPTSLLDVAPTLAAMAGVDTAGMVGMDLRTLASGTAQQAFMDRPLSFGRPLYGLRRWGSLTGGIKYAIHKGEETLFDLSSDPQELTNLVTHRPVNPSRQAITTSLDRPFVPVWRLVLNASKQGGAVRVKLNTPVAAGWVGDDPTMRGKAKVEVSPAQTIARWPKQRGMVEVFVVPPPELPETIELELKVGSRTETHSVVLSGRERPQAGQSDTLLKARLGGRTLSITTSWAPIPSELDSAIEGFDAEVAGDLESLGYIDKAPEN